MTDYSLLPFIDQVKRIPIEGGRGCPYGCTYCSTKTFWKRKFRIKSVDRLINEVKELESMHNVKEFSFIHDLFTVNKKTLLEFCDRLKEEKLDIEWRCSARIDTVDDELLVRMYDSGCTRIYFGIETGSQRMQKLVNKNLNISELQTKLDILKKYKNKEYVFSFIYDFPQEENEDINATLNIIDELLDNGFKGVQLHRLAILAGTELFHSYQNQLVLNDSSDIIEDVDMEASLDIIQEYPNIFPHYYRVKEDKESRIFGLHGFIANFYIPMYGILNRTLALLKEHFQYNLLNVYNSIIDYDRYYFKNNCSQHELFYFKDRTDEYVTFNRLSQVENYLYNVSFGENTNKIREMFKFEKHIMEFCYLSQEKEIIENFNYDVIKGKNTKSMLAEIENNPVTVIFEKTEGEKLIIKKVNSNNLENKELA